jgi:hypothetical protein
LWVAVYFLGLVSERTKAAMAAAKARGKKLGSPVAASRRLNPSIRTAWRTRPYNSTPFIPPLFALRAKSYLPLHFCSGATRLSGRFSEGFCLRRLHLKSSGLLSRLFEAKKRMRFNAKQAFCKGRDADGTGK